MALHDFRANFLGFRKSLEITRSSSSTLNAVVSRSYFRFDRRFSFSIFTGLLILARYCFVAVELFQFGSFGAGLRRSFLADSRLLPFGLLGIRNALRDFRLDCRAMVLRLTVSLICLKSWSIPLEPFPFDSSACLRCSSLSFRLISSASCCETFLRLIGLQAGRLELTDERVEAREELLDLELRRVLAED